MTIKEIKKEFKNRRNFAKTIDAALVEYFDTMLNTFDDLYKNGYITTFDNDFLRFVNGYQINTGNYDTLHINQTFDLRSIKADKKTVKNMMITFLD